MTTETQPQSTDSRKVISATEFDKKVDIEFAYLTWQQYVPEDEARVQARKIVESEFIRKQAHQSQT